MRQLLWRVRTFPKDHMERLWTFTAEVIENHFQFIQLQQKHMFIYCIFTKQGRSMCSRDLNAGKRLENIITLMVSSIWNIYSYFQIQFLSFSCKGQQQPHSTDIVQESRGLHYSKGGRKDSFQCHSSSYFHLFKYF
jgi:hypothetical protein